MCEKEKKDHHRHEDEKPRGREMPEAAEGMTVNVSGQQVGSRLPMLKQYCFEVIR